MGREQMYALKLDPATRWRWWAWHPSDLLPGRLRLAAAALGLVLVVLAIAVASAWSSGAIGAIGGGPLGSAQPVATTSITVAPGDTLWSIAARRYPNADPRQKVFEIEQLNGLPGPAIDAGQRLRVPDR